MAVVADQNNTVDSQATAAEPDRLKQLEILSDLGPHDRYYFGYQYGLGKSYIAPYLESNGVRIANSAICEIGCGEGGVLAALADRGAQDVVGIDIRQEAIDRALKIFSHFGIHAEFDLHDITGAETPSRWRERFDLVTLRDVIEHLDETELSLRHVMDFLKPGGFLYIVFPPYYSPFGAHQHLLRTFWGGIPYLQLLPNALFKSVTSRAKYPVDVPEVARLRHIRLTIGKFRRAVEAAGFEIVDNDLYFLRPVFKLKFGIPPIRANFLKAIPGVRELVALEASYLLRKPD